MDCNPLIQISQKKTIYRLGASLTYTLYMKGAGVPTLSNVEPSAKLIKDGLTHISLLHKKSAN